LLLTLSTICQLPRALALGDSLHRTNPGTPFVIGLADDANRLPAGWQSPYPMLILPDELVSLSGQYTPTEFVAATKPSFIRAALSQYPDTEKLLYADPSSYIYQSLDPVWQRLASANLLLTPHLAQPPADRAMPDEKHVQNVGLYSAGLLAFRRSAETDRLLAWWQDRVTTRAFVDFGEGLCTDQLWLMHTPVLFESVVVVKDPAWQLAVWNLPHRGLRYAPKSGWEVDIHYWDWQPLLSANFRGLTNPAEGFFAGQTRLRLSSRPEIGQLLREYRTAVSRHAQPALLQTAPAYGDRPEPVRLPNWRKNAGQFLTQAIRYVDTFPWPARPRPA
jgi:hypothetical protein